MNHYQPKISKLEKFNQKNQSYSRAMSLFLTRISLLPFTWSYSSKLIKFPSNMVTLQPIRLSVQWSIGFLRFWRSVEQWMDHGIYTRDIVRYTLPNAMDGPWYTVASCGILCPMQWMDHGIPWHRAVYFAQCNGWTTVYRGIMRYILPNGAL